MSDDLANKLSDCSGYAVFDLDGRVGSVADLVYEAGHEQPDYVLVQHGLLHRETTRIPVDNVAEVDPARHRLLIDVAPRVDVGWSRSPEDD